MKKINNFKYSEFLSKIISNKCYFFSLGLIVLFSCNSSKEIIENKKYINDFDEEFKQTAFCNCLIEGLNNFDLSTELVKNDKSFNSPVINTLYKNDIDRILIPVVEKIKQDSVKSLTTAAEGQQGKIVVNNCLNFYNSEELKNLTRLKKYEFQRIKNLDSIIVVKLPAY